MEDLYSIYRRLCPGVNAQLHWVMLIIGLVSHLEQ